MLLRNYDNIVAAYTSIGYQELVGDTTNFGDGHLNFKDKNGNLQNLNSGYNYTTLPMSLLNDTEITYNSSGYSWIVLGSGNTPVTYDDYKLENKLLSSQIVVNGSSRIKGTLIYNEETKTWTKSLSYDFQAKSDVTVSEIGVEYFTANSKQVLVYREVLDTPVSLTTGQYLRVSITTTVSANPNKPADVSATVETV